MARTDNLTNFLSDVATAIKEKKGDSTEIQASQFDNEITNLPTGTSKYAPRFISFYGYSGTELNYELNNLTLENATSMYRMFYNCSKIEKIDLSHVDHLNITNMEQLCYGCRMLTEVNLNGFIVSSSTYQMFYNCSALTKVDLTDFNATLVSNMGAMFKNCEALTELDLSSFVTTALITTSDMFSGCTNLTKLDIRNFVFDRTMSYTNMFLNVPASCEIIVKSDTERNWILDKRSDFTNIKTVAEL